MSWPVLHNVEPGLRHPSAHMSVSREMHVAHGGTPVLDPCCHPERPFVRLRRRIFPEGRTVRLHQKIPLLSLSKGRSG